MPFFNLQNYILEVFKIENSSRLAYFKMPSGCVRFFSSPILHKHPLLIGQARFSSRLRKMGEYSYKSSPLIARSVKYILLQKWPQNQWLAALTKQAVSVVISKLVCQKIEPPQIAYGANPHFHHAPPLPFHEKGL